MPPKQNKKPVPKNAYSCYVDEFRVKEQKAGRHLGLRYQDFFQLAGASWGKMSPSQRAPYEAMAKADKLKGKSGGEKYSSQGVPLSQIEREKREKELAERLMKKEIEDTVKDGFANDTLATQKYYFVMANYFAKTTDCDYIPAEIAVAEYSLKSGVNKKFHTFIDPGTLPIGMGYQAKSHADDTHRLPVPPNAMGERDFGKVIQGLMSFIETDENGQYPPLYAHKHYLEMIKNVMSILENEYFGDNSVNFKIYPIQYLFYTLKMSTAEKGEVKKPESIFISDAIFERDTFEYQNKISCDFHENIDVGKYCALSCVTRWGYMFSDYMCLDLALDLIPGAHLPPGADLSAAKKSFSTVSSYNDDKKSVASTSMRSYASTSVRSNVTQPKIERHYVDDTRSDATEKYPPGGDVRKRTHDPARTFENDSSDEDQDDNPWSTRNKNKPRPPNEDSFSFSSVVAGRGRGIKTEPISSNASTTSRTSGRGRLFQQ